MLAAALGMVLLCLVSGCTKAPKTVINSKTQAITNSIGMELIEIPAGKFTMGSPVGEKGHKYTEGQVAVTLTQPFWLGQTEVTQGQWKKVMGTEPWVGQIQTEIGEDNPASYVNWNDATAFCQKLTDTDHKSGKLPAGESYRLPTDAEWEYACRAGTQTMWSFGGDDKQLGEYAWFRGNTFDAGERYAHTVGMKNPNPWGLHDMHGNVAEWCSDRASHGRKLSGGADPVGPREGDARVFRGGWFWHNPFFCRSASRDFYAPSYRASFLGFRVARSQLAQ